MISCPVRSRLTRETLSVLYHISFKSLIIYSYRSYTRGCLVHHLCALRALLSCTGDKIMCVSYYVTNLTNFYELSSMYWKGIHDIHYKHHQTQHIIVAVTEVPIAAPASCWIPAFDEASCEYQGHVSL